MTRPSLTIIRSPRDIAPILSPWRSRQERIALVPTMGALHSGHLSLVEKAREHADRVVVSIFVNPRQFGPNEDFATYPRGEDSDIEMLAQAGADAAYIPTVEGMYPDGYQTTISVPHLAAPLDGGSRPGFFDGIATVVAKLFNQVRPDIAVFGEKDFQQLLVLRRLVRDLDMGIEIIGAPIVREADGLAMSSRNRYLSASERVIAGHLNQIMRSALARLSEGKSVGGVIGAARDDLIAAGLEPIDYLELRNTDDLSLVAEGVIAPSDMAQLRLFAAVMLGRTRLIDNMGFDG